MRNCWGRGIRSKNRYWQATKNDGLPYWCYSLRVRASDWLLIGYFVYVAFLSPVHTPAIVAAVLVLGLLVVLANREARASAEVFSVVHDWVPLGLVLVAYREMDWFTPAVRDHHLELDWVRWDRWLLYSGGMQRAIESLGAMLAGYLEFCYLLVYAVGPFAVAVMYFEKRRELAQHVVFLYLLGTLLAYALFPYFPSEPPRTLFGGTDMPNVVTALRRVKLWLVGGYGIHSSVFPSAHVSSAFSAAWALLLYLPEKRRFGWGMLIYSISVSIATVYGRYHYAVDAAAGFGVSLIALGITLSLRARRPLRPRALP